MSELIIIILAAGTLLVSLIDVLINGYIGYKKKHRHGRHQHKHQHDEDGRRRAQLARPGPGARVCRATQCRQIIIAQCAGRCRAGHRDARSWHHARQGPANHPD